MAALIAFLLECALVGLFLLGRRSCPAERREAGASDVPAARTFLKL